MRCPQCAQPMRPYLVRQLRLERCGDCGKVWLELGEVSRLFGAVHAELSATELDQPCPNGHGPLVNATLKGRDAAICPQCRGALLGALLTHQLAEPLPNKARAPVEVKCDVCGDWVATEKTAHTIRGSCCPKCALVENPGSRGDDWSKSVAWEVADALLQLVAAILS